MSVAVQDSKEQDRTRKMAVKWQQQQQADTQKTGYNKTFKNDTI